MAMSSASLVTPLFNLPLHAIDAFYGRNDRWRGATGAFIGSLILGWVSDHIGRQKIFNFSFMLITVASFLQFFATTPEQLIGLRILIGIGLGGDYSVGHTLLAEFSPRRHRGILLGAFSVVWTVGYVLASLAGHHFISENPDAWRWLLASSALPALLITVLRWGTPESPRWLMRQGRFAEAHAVVQRCFGMHVQLGDEVTKETNKHIRTLFSSRYWRRAALIASFCLLVIPGLLSTRLPTIAETIGLENALTASLLLNSLLIVGALLGLVLTHLLAHRHFLLGSFLLLAAILIVMACLPPGSHWTLLLLSCSAPRFRRSVILWGFYRRKASLPTFGRWAWDSPPP